jgi:hypothetical protein
LKFTVDLVNHFLLFFLSLPLSLSVVSFPDSELLLLNLLTQRRADHKFIHVGDHSSSPGEDQRSMKPGEDRKLHETHFSLSPGEDQRSMKPIPVKTRASMKPIPVKTGEDPHLHETHSGEDPHLYETHSAEQNTRERLRRKWVGEETHSVR